MYIVRKVEKQVFGKLFCPVSQRMASDKDDIFVVVDPKSKMATII
jgi:hypothetical protein